MVLAWFWLAYLGLIAGDDCEPALEMLQLRARKTETEAEVTNASAPATVYMIFTFGAVATSTSPLKDFSQPSQTFRGLRCYTENLLPMGMRQVDAGANLNQLYHSQVPTVVLRSHGDSDFFDGTGRPDLPAHGTGVRLPDVGLHDMQNYFQRLLSLHLQGRDAHVEKPFASAHAFAYLAWGAYERQQDRGGFVTMESLIKAHLPNWRLVAQEQLDTIEAVDNLWIVQNQNSQDCLLTFEGTHTFTQFFRNLKTTDQVIEYCGFPGVHSGYAEKLRWLMKGVMSKLRPKLSKCYRVGCTGHSLGGALCEIFAACVNSGRVGHPDFEAATWSAGEKELMPQIAQKPLSRDNLGAH